MEDGVGGVSRAASAPSGCRDLIQHYFDAGYTYEVIVTFLQELHNIKLSLRSLKRYLSVMGMKRRGINRQFGHALMCIDNEMKQTGSLLGYRAMWMRLRQKYNIYLSREDVRVLLRVLDPVGVAERRKRRLNRRVYLSKGPHHCWHIDGNDKLLPYGFGIHGAIDGYSRKILWLEVSSTNKDSNVIAGYFLKAVEKFGFPKIVRADKDIKVRIVMIVEETVSIMGSLSINQLIERFWGSLYQWCNAFWIDFFKILRDEGSYDATNDIHRECLKFCFMRVIQSDLDAMRHTWNAHRIRMSKTRANGISNVLFYLPQCQGSQDCSTICNQEDLNLCWQYAEQKPSSNSIEFFNLVYILIEEENLAVPDNAQQALSL